MPTDLTCQKISETRKELFQALSLRPEWLKLTSGSTIPKKEKRTSLRLLKEISIDKGIPHDEETKKRVSESLKKAYAEGRHAPSAGLKKGTKLGPMSEEEKLKRSEGMKRARQLNNWSTKRRFRRLLRLSNRERTGGRVTGLSESPLNVEVKNGQLIISIGINVLADAADFEGRPPFWEYDYTVGNLVQKWKIVDNLGWAQEIRHELLEEKEDGSSPLTDLLDKMSENALDAGSLSVWSPEFDGDYEDSE